MFDREVLEDAFLTENDILVKQMDTPERFIQHKIQDLIIDNDLIIYLSMEVMGRKGIGQEHQDELKNKVLRILEMIKVQHLDFPYIVHYQQQLTTIGPVQLNYQDIKFIDYQTQQWFEIKHLRGLLERLI